MTVGDAAQWAFLVFMCIMGAFVVLGLWQLLTTNLRRDTTLDDLEAKILEKQLRRQLKED